jgi:hypothetical protein
MILHVLYGGETVCQIEETTKAESDCHQGGDEGVKEFNKRLEKNAQ